MPAVWGWAGMSRLNPLLILDLDETLLFSTEEDPGCGVVFRAGPYFTRLRPYLSDFLNTVSAAYDLAIWSSSSGDYAKAMAEIIFAGLYAPVFVWGRDRCSQSYDMVRGEMVFKKRVRKATIAGYSLQRILIVDDSPEKVADNYGNAIYVTEWTGAPDDTELLRLGPYLLSIRDTPDFRSIEKRFWRA